MLRTLARALRRRVGHLLRPRGMARAPLPRKRIADARGATSVEYGFVLALIVLAAMVGIDRVGKANSDVWGNVSQSINKVTG